jgi:hypothetical protein
MRFAVAVISMVWACTGVTKRERNGLPYRYVPPRPPGLPAECSPGSDNEVTTGAELGSDPPIIVLDDFLPCFGQDPPRPRVAIWSDGTIMFARAGVRAGESVQELVQGTIPSNDVNKLIADIANAVERSPRRFDTRDPNVGGLGGGQTSLIVWDHGHWRAAIVNGAFPREFLRATTQPVGQPEPPQAAPPPATPTTGSDEVGIGISFSESFAPPIPPPTRFARAYKELLDARPADGAPITRDNLSVTFFPLRVAGDEALAHERRELPWPAELPQPPVDVEPCADDAECVRDIAPAQRELADQLRQEIHRSKLDVELTAHGKHFLARFDSHYHGERGILQLERCAAQLGEPTR